MRGLWCHDDFSVVIWGSPSAWESKQLMDRHLVFSTIYLIYDVKDDYSVNDNGDIIIASLKPPSWVVAASVLSREKTLTGMTNILTDSANAYGIETSTDKNTHCDNKRTLGLITIPSSFRHVCSKMAAEEHKSSLPPKNSHWGKRHRKS